MITLSGTTAIAISDLRALTHARTHPRIHAEKSRVNTDNLYIMWWNAHAHAEKYILKYIKVHLIMKLCFKYYILSVSSFPSVRNSNYFRAQCNAQMTAILPTYYVSPGKLCWTRSSESTNRNASRIIGRCNGLQVWENVTAEAATAYSQRYKTESLLCNLVGRNEKYSWDSS